MINPEALAAASQVIEKKFKDLSDLHPELQNTIANIYYQGALIGMNPMGAFLKEGGVKKINDWIIDVSFITSALKHLPEIIESFREDVLPKGNQREIDLITETFLLMYKFRLTLGAKPLFVLRLQKMFNRKRVDEITGLYTKMLVTDKSA